MNDKEFKYEELRKYRTHTKEFEVVFPDRALFGAKPGPSLAVADEYYMITSRYLQEIIPSLLNRV